MKKILQLSVYYGRGGAGTIAKYIHEETIERGMHSLFLYSFGKMGFQKIEEENLKGVPYISLFTPHLNFLTHKLIGIDLIPANRKKLKKLIENFDVIHLHVIHSHGINYKQLTTILAEADKKVVITCHDSWYYTGRCAIRNQCNLWQEGCPKCPHLDYYPASTFDFAKTEYKNKIKAFNSIDKLTFVSPSNWIAEDMKKTYPTKRVVVIKNGINTLEFKKVKIKPSQKKLKYLFVTNDYKEEFKVNFEVLQKIVDSGEELHLVGKNSPFEGENVVNHGYLSEKATLVKIISDCDVLFFFSIIDNFPTILIEGLCTGIFIACFDSKGTREVLSSTDNYLFFDDYADLQNKLTAKLVDNKIKNFNNRQAVKDAAIEFFSIKRMTDEYLKIYD